MKNILVVILFVLLISIVIPLGISKTYNAIIEDKDIISDIKDMKIEKDMEIQLFDTKTQTVIDVPLEEYIMGVVAAEMPAKFNLEALKAQAVAARTFALYRISKYPNGHPSHPDSGLCNGVHCQAWLSKESLKDTHGKDWMLEYWPKIETSVLSTKGEIVTYNNNLIEPLFHSVSGGMTENSEEYFASRMDYLRSVPSPHEDGAPRLNGQVSLSIEAFINKLENKYPNIHLTEDNIKDKILLVNKSNSGRITQVKIDNEVVSGRDLRELFNLNSTNFKIYVLTDKDEIQIKTVGYGHGVGMSQWGANGMGNNGYTYEDILKHYYTGIDITNIHEK
ncbi:stage II sporulation protein D [Clostridiaceae bacterium M8S5]|nr:stage II sporulation protein D [Clostridiaceae bacterium M8S5]